MKDLMNALIESSLSTYMINVQIIRITFSKQLQEKNIQTRGSFRKLKRPFHKINAGQIALSFIGQSP